MNTRFIARRFDTTTVAEMRATASAGNNKVITPDFGTALIARSRPALKVVGVFADLPAHVLATSLLRNVTRNCSTVCKLDSAWWSFDMLTSASVRETATRAAADADMIWCSTYACEALPERVRVWVDAWTESRDKSDAALVALLRCPSNYKVEHSPARAYLSQAAEAAGIELFVQRFDCAYSASLNPPYSVRLQIRNQIDEYHPDWQQVRHWGINE